MTRFADKFISRPQSPLVIKIADLYPKIFAITVRSPAEEKVFNQHFAKMQKKIPDLKKRQVLI